VYLCGEQQQQQQQYSEGFFSLHHSTRVKLPKKAAMIINQMPLFIHIANLMRHQIAA
jgi:hypothetical protein